MDDHESISIIMMLALSALLGVIILICWCRDLWQERAAIRWATQPLVDSADKGDGPESVQHGLRDAAQSITYGTFVSFRTGHRAATPQARPRDRGQPTRWHPPNSSFRRKSTATAAGYLSFRSLTGDEIVDELDLQV